MDVAAHLLLLLVVSASPSPEGTVPYTAPLAAQQSWTAQGVVQLTVENAPLAAALQSERRAVGCGLDRDDRAVCAQVGLIQAVLADLAAHDQNRAAGDALAVYYQILGLEQQQTLLDDADGILDELIGFAERAEQLELPDGDARALRQRRLALADQAVQAETGIAQLRIRLAELTGQQPQVVLDVPLPHHELASAASAGGDATAGSGDRGLDLSSPEAQSAVAVATARRADLRAIRTLCRCMTADALPSARRLLGVVQPGLGLTVARAARSPLMALHASAEPTEDLACRRVQCQQLLEMRERQARAEVLRELVEVQLAGRRLALQKQATELADQIVEETARAVELEQATIGADRLAELEALEARGQSLQRQVDAAVARVRLRQSQGIAAQLP